MKITLSDIYDNLASLLMLLVLCSIVVYFIAKTIKLLYA